jgi:pilus assembly protein CpaC
MTMPPVIRKRPAQCLLFGAALAWATIAPTPLPGQNMQELKMIVGRSVVVDYPAEIGRISTSNPETVDYVAVTTREILLHAKSHGNATLIVWSKSGQREFYNITVEHNLEPIRRILKATFPTESIEVQSARDTVTLIGTVSAQSVADRALAVATPLAKAVVNNLKLTTPKIEKQILLRVKFAELNRNAADSFGVNLLSTGAGNTVGRIDPGGNPAPSTTTIGGGTGGNSQSPAFTISDALNIFAFRPDLNVAAFVRALQGRGLLQILAEPNLVTENGQAATFLVGGEFPIPILQPGAAAAAVTIQFREFGIRLNFKPQLTENNTIKMYVKPEVNTIDIANGVTISGFTIPALATRRIETNVELGLGQSFVIGGLIDDRLTNSVNRIPGLSAVPLLGNLFRSRAENKTKTELIVLVTPEVTSPISATDRKPAIDFPYAFLPALKPAPPAPTVAQPKKTTAPAPTVAQPKKTTAPASPNKQANPKKSSGLKKLLWGGRGKTS